MQPENPRGYCRGQLTAGAKAQFFDKIHFKTLAAGWQEDRAAVQSQLALELVLVERATPCAAVTEDAAELETLRQDKLEGWRRERRRRKEEGPHLLHRELAVRHELELEVKKHLAAGVIAIRQALDVTTGKAVATAVLGWVAYVVLNTIVN